MVSRFVLANDGAPNMGEVCRVTDISIILSDHLSAGLVVWDTPAPPWVEIRFKGMQVVTGKGTPVSGDLCEHGGTEVAVKRVRFGM